MSIVKNLSLGDTLYRIELITEGDSLTFVLSRFEETFDKIYKITKSKAELQEDPYLVQFESVDLIRAFILKRLEANTFTILSEENNLIFSIYYTNGLDENKELKYTLPGIKIEKEEIINILMSVVRELNVESKELKKSKETMTEDINNLKKDVKFLKDQITFFPNPNASFVASPDEIKILYQGIKERIGREPRGIRKVYQATLHGGDSNSFHERCDGRNFTLTFVRSEGGRRFGGFATSAWDSGDEYVEDTKAFVFSLDKKKIYPYKNNGKAIWCREDFGPSFGCGGGGNDFRILGNCLVNSSAYTYETSPYCSYDYGGDRNALSEDGVKRGFKILECEVYQVLF
ncbi:MAG: TLD domain-containing protein [archaeon]|nr:TLD domain-containing protein [archaeon]